MSGTRQFLKERTLFTGEVRWETYLDTSIEIAAAITAQTWHALAGQAEQATVLRLRRNGEREFPSIWRRHGNLTTQHHGDQVYIRVGIEIITPALKQALQDGRLTKQRIDEAATRIIALKMQYHLMPAIPPQ